MGLFDNAPTYATKGTTSTKTTANPTQKQKTSSLFDDAPTFANIPPAKSDYPVIKAPAQTYSPLTLTAQPKPLANRISDVIAKPAKDTSGGIKDLAKDVGISLLTANAKSKLVTDKPKSPVLEFPINTNSASNIRMFQTAREEQAYRSNPANIDATNSDITKSFSDLARTVPRALVGIGNTDKVVDPLTDPGFNKLSRFLVGDEEITGYSRKAVETEDSLKAKGFKDSTAKWLGGLYGVGSAAFDLSPLYIPFANSVNDELASIAQNTGTKQIKLTYKDFQDITSGKITSGEKYDALKSVSADIPKGELRSSIQKGGIDVTATGDSLLKRATGPIGDIANPIETQYSLTDQPTTPNIPKPISLQEARSQAVQSGEVITTKSPQEVAPVEPHKPLADLKNPETTLYKPNKLNEQNRAVISDLPEPKPDTVRIYHTRGKGEIIKPGSYVDTNIEEHVNRGTASETKIVADIPKSELTKYLNPGEGVRADAGIYKVTNEIPEKYVVKNTATQETAVTEPVKTPSKVVELETVAKKPVENKISFREPEEIDSAYAEQKEAFKYKIIGELENAEAGYRIITDQDGQGSTKNTTGVSSSFPKWIPEELREKGVLEGVLRHIQKDTLPASNSTKQKALYEIVRERIAKNEAKVGPDEQVDIINKAITESQIEPISKPRSTIEGDKVSKAAFESNKALVDAGMKALPEDQLAKFTSIKKAETIDKVSKLLTETPELARDIIRGGESQLSSAEEQVLFNSLSTHAEQTGDVDLLLDLATSPIATERSLAAQTLGASGFNKNPESVVSKLQQIKKARIDRAGGATKVAKKTADLIKQVKKATKQVNLSPKDLEWDSFLDEIKC